MSPGDRRRSGCSAAWQRASFGTKRSWVQIPPPRQPKQQVRHLGTFLGASPVFGCVTSCVATASEARACQRSRPRPQLRSGSPGRSASGGPPRSRPCRSGRRVARSLRAGYLGPTRSRRTTSGSPGWSTHALELDSGLLCDAGEDLAELQLRIRRVQPTPHGHRDGRGGVRECRPERGEHRGARSTLTP